MARERNSERARAEGVRRRVAIRNPFVERPPVRQKSNPSTFYHQPFHPKTGRKQYEEEGNRARYWEDASFWNKFHQKDGRETISFFFKNFPNWCSIEYLKEKFSRIGRVVDIFCPQKKDKGGNPFGFVRFPAKYDESSILEGLNNIWIDSYKLRAFRPKFERRGLENEKEMRKINEDSKGEVEGRKVRVYSLKAGLGSRDSSRSYIEALGVRKREPEILDKKDANMFHFTSNPEETKWLKECFTCLLRKEFQWEDIEDEIRSECGDGIALFYLGDDAVLIQKNSKLKVCV